MAIKIFKTWGCLGLNILLASCASHSFINLNKVPEVNEKLIKKRRIAIKKIYEQKKNKLEQIRNDAFNSNAQLRTERGKKSLIDKEMHHGQMQKSPP
jgi:hypothetical protein